MLEEEVYSETKDDLISQETLFDVIFTIGVFVGAVLLFIVALLIAFEVPIGVLHN